MCSRAQELQLLSPYATTSEAYVPKTWAQQQEKALQWETHAPNEEHPPLTTTRESSCSSEEGAQPKVNKFKFIIFFLRKEYSSHGDIANHVTLQGKELHLFTGCCVTAVSTCERCTLNVRDDFSDNWEQYVIYHS